MSPTRHGTFDRHRGGGFVQGRSGDRNRADPPVTGDVVPIIIFNSNSREFAARSVDGGEFRPYRFEEIRPGLPDLPYESALPDPDTGRRSAWADDAALYRQQVERNETAPWAEWNKTKPRYRIVVAHPQAIDVFRFNPGTFFRAVYTLVNPRFLYPDNASITDDAEGISFVGFPLSQCFSTLPPPQGPSGGFGVLNGQLPNARSGVNQLFRNAWRFATVRNQLKVQPIFNVVPDTFPEDFNNHEWFMHLEFARQFDDTPNGIVSNIIASDIAGPAARVFSQGCEVLGAEPIQNLFFDTTIPLALQGQPDATVRVSTGTTRRWLRTVANIIGARIRP